MNFYSNPKSKIDFSYSDFIQKINEQNVVYTNLINVDIVSFWVNLVKAIISNTDIIVYDLDHKFNLSTSEFNFDANNIIFLVSKVEFTSIEELKDLILSSKSNLTIFTSGTTGQPQKITHKISNILREVRINSKHQFQNWAFTYNPTHIAGLQVFFQILLNECLLIDVFSDRNINLADVIVEYDIKYLSGTPTFYRLILNEGLVFDNVKYVSVGGEKSDIYLIDKIEKTFPNAKINNIYASTEAGTVLASDGLWFYIPKNKADLVQIINNELQIHISLIGESNDLTTNWYATGDIVEFNENDSTRFKFVNRTNELLNIGGNKVNPSEIESEINKIINVVESQVYGKRNSVLGTILCADVVVNSELTENYIREKLRFVLQEYKIPGRIYFKNEILKNRAGKLIRK